MEPIRYSVAACQTDQPNPIDRREMRRDTDRMLAMIDSALAGTAPFLLSHLRAEAYPVHAAHRYPPRREDARVPLSYGENLRLIAEAKRG